MNSLNRNWKFLLVPIVLILFLIFRKSAVRPESLSLSESSKSTSVGSDLPNSQDHWSLSTLSENGKKVQIVRIHETPTVNQKAFPVLIVVHGLTKSQMPNESELDDFDVAENKVEILEKGNNCILMVCTTGKGERIWYYYAKNIETAKEIAIALKTLHPKIDVSPDPKWNCYREFLEMKRKAE
jgi:hypothetical protein